MFASPRVSRVLAPRILPWRSRLKHAFGTLGLKRPQEGGVSVRSTSGIWYYGGAGGRSAVPADEGNRQMAVMKIYLYGEEVLRKTASPVEEIDDDVRQLVRNMAETMRQASGVGLAAPQVGDSRRIIVAEVPQEHKSLIALINPKIVESEGTSEFEEGCLSIPGITAKVKRAAEVVVETLTPEGEQLKKKYTGLLATVIQHEIDHLDGILFVDRLGFLGRSALSFKLRSLAKTNKT